MIEYTFNLQPQTVVGIRLFKAGVLSEDTVAILKEDKYGASLIKAGFLLFTLPQQPAPIKQEVPVAKTKKKGK